MGDSSDLKLAASVAAGVHARVPGRASPRMAFAAGALALLLFAGWEGSLVASGVTPDSLPGELDLWLENYRKIGPDSVVFVGSSRTQQDISPAVVAEVLGIPHERVINLGISAGPGLPMLEHFAAREDFKGTLVVEILPTHDFGGEPSPMQNACIEQLVRPRPYSDAELAMHTAWATNLRSVSEHGSPLAAARAVTWRMRGEEMSSNKVAQQLHRDRWREILSPEPDNAKRKADAEDTARTFSRWGKPPQPWQLEALIARYDAAARKLESRGGVVILARMHSGLSVLEAEEQRFPRVQTWDTLARRLPGRCWHFAGDPVASRLQTFDGSHLRGEDAVALSRRLGELLKGRMR
ncbi:MAG: hypothetical protein IT462_08935 [Planctomycetes bacterium]|nr:hypothetical protein [Planctomycetota bacterium]